MPTFVGTFVEGGIDSDIGTYSSQLIKLLPPGRLWNLEQDSDVRALMVALADEMERVRVRGHNLIDEGDPRYCSETIADWEAMVGLPDELVPVIPATLEERRVAVAAKIVARGGQNYTYFETLCAACGYPLLSIHRGIDDMLRVGFRVDDRVFGDEYAYSMTLTLDTPTAGALSEADFERVIVHNTHGHIKVIFSY